MKKTDTSRIDGWARGIAAVGSGAIATAIVIALPALLQAPGWIALPPAA